MTTSIIDEASTVPAKYIFLDVVNFTRNRSVEAQSEIVGILNSIVKESLQEHLPDDKMSQLILLPTGDGICIAFLNIETPYDIHLQVGVDTIKRVYSHSEAASDEMRKFQVRVGINANTDNLVTDINGSRNIAGAGINTAQRVMSMADGNQILVGQTVYETLVQREKYIGAFKEYRAIVKHDVPMPMYQFVATGYTGLNIDVPLALVVEVPVKSTDKLSKLAAYYFAHAIKNREFLLSKKGETSQVGAILLWFWAKDSIQASRASEVDTIKFETFQADKGDKEEQYAHYYSLMLPLGFSLYELIKETQIPTIYNVVSETALISALDYYEGVSDYRFISSQGMAKLKTEWPSIWAEFELNQYASNL